MIVPAGEISVDQAAERGAAFWSWTHCTVHSLHTTRIKAIGVGDSLSIAGAGTLDTQLFDLRRMLVSEETL